LIISELQILYKNNKLRQFESLFLKLLKNYLRHKV